MIKLLGVVALSLGLGIGPAAAQGPADSLLLRFADFKKEKIAARACLSEEAQMQVERNEHYDAFLRANAADPGAPTLHEISAALLETRLRDDALNEKRRDCELLLDDVMSAVKELRRECVAYPLTPDPNEDPSPSEIAAIDICRAATGNQAYASANQAPQ